MTNTLECNKHIWPVVNLAIYPTDFAMPKRLFNF